MKSVFLKVIDRLGTAGFRRLEAMAGGQAVSSVTQRLGSSDLGTLDTVTSVEVGGKRYLRLENTRPGSVRLVSLCVGSLGEQQSEELEDVVRRSIASLSDLLTQARPRVLPGGGCLEARLSLRLRHVSPRLARQLLRLSLVPGRLNMAEAALEADTGHLVSDQTQETCQCGLRTRGQATLIPALEIYNRRQGLSPSILIQKGFTDNLNVLESFTYKKAAILTAVEAAQNLSNIGMILNC